MNDCVEIKLVMNEDGAINIVRNGTVKISMKKDNRSISAMDIYELVNYSTGSRYTVSSDNQFKVDEIVLDELKYLINEICNYLNGLSNPEEQ